MKKFDENREKKFVIILIIIIAVTSGSIALLICSRIDAFWNIDRLDRFTLFLLIFFLLAIFEYSIFRMQHLRILRFDFNFGQIKLLISLIISVALFLSIIYDYSPKVPVHWVFGLGTFFEIAALVIFLLFALPILFYILIETIIHVLEMLFPNPLLEFRNTKYNHLFFILFLFISFSLGISSTKENGFEEEIWKREYFLRYYSKLRYFIGDQLFQDSIISNNDWLIFATDISLHDYQNTWPLSVKRLDNLEEKIHNLNRDLSDNGTILIIAIAPNKNTIYPEFLPEEIPVLGELSRLDQVSRRLGKYEELRFLNLEDVLLDAKVEQQVFYATDTHWNPHGAFYAYREIMKEINDSFAEVNANSLDEFEKHLVPERSGDVALRLLNLDLQENFYNLVLIDNPDIEYQIVSKTHREYFDSHSNEPTLMMFHDSFGFELIPFLYPHFGHSIFFRSAEINPFQIRTLKPDILLLVWTERSFYFNLNNLPASVYDE